MLFTPTRTGARLVAGAVLLLLPLRAPGADDIEALSLDELLNMPVETSSRRLQPLAWAPASSVVITQGQIRARHYVNLKDLLRDLPGVDVYDSYSEGARQLVSIRGNPGNNQFLILLDGQRLTAPTGEHLSVDDNYPLAGIKQVEVIFGPASALYGADAFSGIINLITAERPEAAGGEAVLSYGTGNYKYGAASAHAALGEKVRLEVRGHLHHADNAHLPTHYPADMPVGPLKDPFSGEVVSATRDDAYSNATSSYSLSAAAHVDGGLTLRFDQRRFDQQSGTSVHPSYTLYGPEAQVQWRMLTAEHRAELTPALTLESSLRHNAVVDLPDYRFRNFFSGWQTVYKRMSSQALTAQEQLSWDVTPEHNLIAGFSWAQVHSAPESSDLTKRVDPNLPPATQDLLIPGTDLPVPLIELDYQTVGGYLQAQSQWSAQLSTTVGVRFDHDTRFGSTLNPRLGAVYQLHPGNTLKLLYGESFLAPPTEVAYDLFGSFDGVDEATGKPLSRFFHLPNPDLAPQRARTLELSHTLLLGGTLLVDSSAYVSRVTGRVVQVLREGREEFAGGIVTHTQRPQSIGRALLYGGAVTLTQRSAVGDVAVEPWLSYSLSLGWEDEGAGTPRTELAYNTPHKLKGGLTFRHRSLSLTPRFRLQSGTTHPLLVDGRRMRVPGSGVVDVALHAERVLGALSLTLDVRNLLDARHYAPAIAGPVNLVASPQDPRLVMLQASYAL